MTSVNTGTFAPYRTLVLGGTRSGKSTIAEDLFQHFPTVTYVATGPAMNADNEAWAQRVAAHQQRRPAHWRTVETTDPAAVIRAVNGPVFIDCLSTWLAAHMDLCGAWEDRPGWRQHIQNVNLSLVRAWRDAKTPVLAVSAEIGLGILPESAGSRLFCDLLGLLNQQIAAHSDRVLLVVAGRALELPAIAPGH